MSCHFNPQSALDCAIYYAEYGYAVIPLKPGTKEPATAHGITDATTDTEKIEAWWQENPAYNIGLSATGLLIVDIDGPDNPWPHTQEQALDLAQVPISLTPRGGSHHVFKGGGFRNTSGALAPKVDTRADGGYIVAPPSIVAGKVYAWFEGRAIGEQSELLQPPRWLMDGLAYKANPQSKGVERAAGNTIPSGQRNHALTSLAGKLRGAGAGYDEILACISQTNISRCKPSLPSEEVAKIAWSVSRYEPDAMTVATVEGLYTSQVDLSGLVGKKEQIVITVSEPNEIVPESPFRLVPVELLRVPGFISELMDVTLSRAFYPNQCLAFAGALAMQAFLGGRKVRDVSNTRTNIYLLSLAHSASGKDIPRKINAEIMMLAGFEHSFGSRFASGEGLQDALQHTPNMLFQTDEIDGMLQSIAKSQDARYDGIMNMLLELYTTSDSIMPMRRKAKDDKDKPPQSIYNPSLTLLGSAIPENYYSALSEKMLSNGFFARLLALEAGPRGAGQDPEAEPLERDHPLISTALWWKAYNPGGGNLGDTFPRPAIVEYSPDAKAYAEDVRRATEAEYSKAESNKETALVETTVWGRAYAMVKKLALIYAISENHHVPQIRRPAVEWAWSLVEITVNHALARAREHVAAGDFDALCKKAIAALQATGGVLSHSHLLKRMKLPARQFLDLIGTLDQRGDIAKTEIPSKFGRPAIGYRLL